MKKQHAILVALLLCGIATSLHAQTPSTLNVLAAESITAGARHTCVLTNGAAKCWGRNSAGQLGDGTFADSQIRVQVDGLTTNVEAIAAGAAHTCAIANGAAKCWGGNDFGELGRGFVGNAFNTPQLVIDLETSVTAIATGNNHACAIQNGAAKCWGINRFGQLGNNTQTNSATPVQVIGLSTGVMSIATRNIHTCAVQK